MPSSSQQGRDGGGEGAGNAGGLPGSLGSSGGGAVAAPGGGPAGAAGLRSPSSGSSSPCLPQTEEERNEREKQQDIDLHLATTMSRSLDPRAGRARSGSRSAAAGAVAVHDIAIDDRRHDDDESEEPYGSRRDAQAEQDAHFFDASASPAARGMMGHSHRTPTNSNSAAAARFYRQNRRRTLSDTSVDSAAGFIDHRKSQASMPLRQAIPSSARSDRHLTPRDMVRSAAKSKSSRMREEMRSRTQQRPDRRARSNSGNDSEEDEDDDEGDDDDDEQEDEDARKEHGSPSAPATTGRRKKGRARRGTGLSGISNTKPHSPPGVSMAEASSGLDHASSFNMPDDVTARDYSSHHLDGTAGDQDGDDEEPGVVDHRGLAGGHSYAHHHRGSLQRNYLNRTGSNRSDGSRHGDRRSLHDDDEEHGDFTPSLSRRPSDAQMVEEDVCYPMLQMREAEMEDREGGGGGQSPPRDSDTHRHGSFTGGRDRHSMGIPGVLPNFPFPFDFDALEEYCEKEREKDGIAIPKAKARGDGSDFTVIGTATAANATARGVSFSPDKTAGGEGGSGSMMRRRMNGEFTSRRQRKLSESVGHVGRYQRKLALFEEGTSSGQRNDDKAGPDVKTPLLAEQTKSGRPSFGATAFGSHRGGTTPASERARPYRFSFYSNALPSTIHARSLAEIPGDGQTFEELFVGRHTSTPPEEWEGSVVHPNDASNSHENMLPGQRPGTSGTSTPNNGGHHNGTIPPSVASASYKATTNGPPSRMGGNYDHRPRASMIRSMEDAEANTWWLDVLCPTDAEMKVLGKVFGIHPLTIEDILMEETREKIELFRNYYLVCFRSFDQDPYSPTYLEPLNMYIIVFREGTLSFHFRGTPHPQNVRRRIKQLKDFINVTSDWISYALIDDITDAFGPLIQNIEYEVDSIDELVLILKDAEQSDMLRRIGTCRKKVMGLLRLMGNKADVVKGLAKRCNENWLVAPKSDIGLYLSDIQDHLITMTQNLNHYEKILSRSHSNYLAQISIEMTDANNQINDVLSKLTALGTVLIPMNLVTGLWGMNVRVPGEAGDNLNWFFGIVACLLAFALLGGWLTYRAFKK